MKFYVFKLILDLKKNSFEPPIAALVANAEFSLPSKSHFKSKIFKWLCPKSVISRLVETLQCGRPIAFLASFLLLKLQVPTRANTIKKNLDGLILCDDKSRKIEPEHSQEIS